LVFRYSLNKKHNILNLINMKIKRNLGYYQLFVIYFFVIIVISCAKKDLPEITTSEVTSITQTTANCGGMIISDGGSTVLSRGVCWSVNNTPSINDKKSTNGAGAGTFVSPISELTPNTIYFVRAYATNATGTGYGMAMSFTSQPATIPVLITANVTNITQNTAISGGTITSDGAASITARGVCWSTFQNPTIDDNKTSDGSGIGIFVSTMTELSGNTTYYVRAYASNMAGIEYGNQFSFKTSPLMPSISTAVTTPISQSTATSGGNISSDGGGNVTARGVCWSTLQNPTTSNSKTSDGSGTGSFTSTITGLGIGTTYYVRAYATNIVGTSYGNELSFKINTVTDINGNVYNTVVIGSQTWMAENLKTTTFNDGVPIPLITDNTEWTNLTTSGYCWYQNEIGFKSTYGALYNWYTVNTGKICPQGWHVPSDIEWTNLSTYLGGTSIAGGKMKETGTTHWLSPNTGATNESGFLALPGGNRYDSGFINIGSLGGWWGSTEYSTTEASWRALMSIQANLSGDYHFKRLGLSIRCVKD
jgi:uncharacterized protein (TIGR02145 family)